MGILSTAVPTLTSDLLNTSSLGTFQRAWAEWLGGMVGAENVQFVTILFFALLGLSVIGFILKMVKSVFTALCLAIGFTILIGSFGFDTYTKMTPKMVQAVMREAADNIAP